MEYPKWVYLTDGPQESYPEGQEPVLVQNAEEEAEVTGKSVKAVEKEAAAHVAKDEDAVKAEMNATLAEVAGEAPAKRKYTRKE